MKTIKFTADQFVATEFHTAEDKARFCNHFVKFVLSGFNPNLFHKWFYTQLSFMFGHIAEGSQAGFYETWFSSESTRFDFFWNIARHDICGDPHFTYSDVEVVLKKVVKDSQNWPLYRNSNTHFERKPRNTAVNRLLGKV